MKFGVPNVIAVEVYVDRQQVVTLEGIAAVEYRTEIRAGIGNTNTFSEGYEPLAESLYTFDRQSDGTWLIHAEVDGTPLYIDPHAGAGNGGRPSRDYQTFNTLEDGIDGAVKLHELNGGYLHFWDNDDSKLYWDQCTADGGHTGHHLLIYRPANENEVSSQEVPGFVQVNGVSGIADGGQYLIVGKANSGGYYALRPSLSTGKYQHLCKVAGPVTELTITGLREGTGTILAGSYILEVSVLAPSEVSLELDYNYTDALGHDWHGTGCSRCDAKRENPFVDVPEDSFYIDPVLWAVEEGITNGTTETTFDPDGDCMRASVVTFLWRAAGEPGPPSPRIPSPT